MLSQTWLVMIVLLSRECSNSALYLLVVRSVSPRVPALLLVPPSPFGFELTCSPFLFAAAAERLNLGACETAINWAGGLHHAKKREASGPLSPFQPPSSSCFLFFVLTPSLSFGLAIPRFLLRERHRPRYLGAPSVSSFTLRLDKDLLLV